MTEVEYIIANFSERFADFRDKRIVLHGSRNYAEAIIDNFADRFNFIGIMSLDPVEGEFFHGLQVLREEELPELDVDVIILTERVRYAVNAFYSIRRICKENKISVYNMYGLDEFAEHRQAENAKPFSLEEAKRMCDSYDIIAFEAMRTVLCFSPASDISARKLFCDLIGYLHAHNKEIRFSLKKTFPADIQIEELEEYGLLQNKEQEIIRREGEDLSFRRLREDNPEKKILYFGSGLAYEYILPKCYGIDACRFVEVYAPTELISRPRKQKKPVPFNPDLRKEIEKQILEKQLVSFDIFDTLLIRKTLYPRDIFFLTERKIILAGYNVSNFVSARIRAEENQALCDIKQIYEWLQDHFNWDDETSRKILEMELETEREMLLPRKEIVELLYLAESAGKKTVLTSDMYLPENILRSFLSEKGISGYDKIIVSCEVKKAKQNGLYEELLQLCSNPDQILHIGDNPIADGEACNSFGISSVVLPSALSMAMNRGWAKTVQTASSLMERCLLGLVISKIFRDPFQNPNHEIESGENQLWRFGLCVVAPLVAGHMTWLIKELQKEHFSGVLFFARDGWLSINIYKHIQKRYNLPKAVYYYANRKSASLCCIDLPKEMEELKAYGKTIGLNLQDMLKVLFQVPEQKILPYSEGETASEYIQKHMHYIHTKAAESRRGYINYSAKCGVLPDNSYAVVDFITIGTVQKFLSRVLPFKIKGFLFGCHSPASLIDDGTDYYLRGQNPLLLERYIIIEPFFSSPEPSQKCMEENGEPVFDKEQRCAEELKELKSVWHLAESFAVEFFDLFYQEGEFISPLLIEEIFATEDYYVKPYTVYEDWLGTPINLRKNGE